MRAADEADDGTEKRRASEPYHCILWGRSITSSYYGNGELQSPFLWHERRYVAMDGGEESDGRGERVKGVGGKRAMDGGEEKGGGRERWTGGKSEGGGGTRETVPVLVRIVRA